MKYERCVLEPISRVSDCANPRPEMLIWSRTASYIWLDIFRPRMWDPWVPQFAVMILVRNVKLSSQIFCVISIRHHYVGPRPRHSGHHQHSAQSEYLNLWPSLSSQQRTAPGQALPSSLHRGHLLCSKFHSAGRRPNSTFNFHAKRMLNHSLSSHEIWTLAKIFAYKRSNFTCTYYVYSLQ